MSLHSKTTDDRAAKTWQSCVLPSEFFRAPFRFVFIRFFFSSFPIGRQETREREWSSERTKRVQFLMGRLRSKGFIRREIRSLGAMNYNGLARLNVFGYRQSAIGFVQTPSCLSALFPLEERPTERNRKSSCRSQSYLCQSFFSFSISLPKGDAIELHSLHTQSQNTMPFFLLAMKKIITILFLWGRVSRRSLSRQRSLAIGYRPSAIGCARGATHKHN